MINIAENIIPPDIAAILIFFINKNIKKYPNKKSTIDILLPASNKGTACNTIKKISNGLLKFLLLKVWITYMKEKKQNFCK